MDLILTDNKDLSCIDLCRKIWYKWEAESSEYYKPLMLRYRDRGPADLRFGYENCWNEPLFLVHMCQLGTVETSWFMDSGIWSDSTILEAEIDKGFSSACKLLNGTLIEILKIWSDKSLSMDELQNAKAAWRRDPQYLINDPVINDYWDRILSAR